ncbi:MAG TPA: hypothetical protein DHW82_04810 [Spirochaetia bacterium]|nr:MAG: hypothetical protein A2Y41_12590 [Spirochaetes bacterium GWB1_36_13]HCL56315.1 hypothetical protein [Spirochaetia bacterium]
MKFLAIFFRIIYTLFVLGIILFFSIYLLPPIQKAADRYFLKKMANQVSQTEMKNSEEALEKTIQTFSLEEQTKPLYEKPIRIETLDRWLLGKKMISKKIIFPSQIRHHDRKDEAVFYLYTHENLGKNKLLLFVPGMGVSDLAFFFLSFFFAPIVDSGYDLAVFVPPFHLDRIETGKERGEGFFTRDIEKNLFIFLESVREIRTGIQYFKNRKVEAFAGWGGSMGASMLLLASTHEKFEKLTLMIPVLDWYETLSGNEYWQNIIQDVEKSGIKKETIHKALTLISPVSYTLPIQPDKTQILYAKEDSLINEQSVLLFAEKYKIKNIIGYHKSHSTILLDYFLYQDYEDFLQGK